MTIDQPARRRLLPFLGTVRHGNRSHLTCRYRCGNACDARVANPTDNPYFGDVVTASGVSRRGLLTSAGAGALVVGAGSLLPATPVAAAGPPTVRSAGGLGAAPVPRSGSALTFRPVAPNSLDELVTAPGYAYDVVLRWGDPVTRDAPPFDPLAQTAAAQAQQFGYNCDYVAVLPLRRGGRDDRRALLVVNHEYTDEQLMFPGVEGPEDTTAEQKRVAMAAHGISVVEIQRVGSTGRWRPAPRRAYNRRITATTPVELTGPAAGSEYLRTSADPEGRTVLGTLNDCAGGTTPWGTTLHGEENFDQYFGSSEAVVEDPREPRLARYSVAPDQLGDRHWEEVDPRFDLTREPNEVNRFGWVIELDPYDPHSVPRKRTALGRLKHEGATVRVAEDGRVVAYTGDDERFEYVYKFVSRDVYDPAGTSEARTHNLALLDDGDLYVARFTGDSPGEEVDGTGALPSDEAFDGTGRWIPLVRDGESMIPGKSVAWVLTFTRLAADRLGKRLDGDGNFPDPENPVVERAALVPTRMDRPEDVQTNPVNGRVYAALTNNSRRTSDPDEANPLTRSWAFQAGEDAPGTYELRPGNRNGHVIEWTETDGVAGRDFYWKVFLVAGDPEKPETYFAGYDKSRVSPISCPDNLEFDPAGNLWIATDGNALSIVNQQQGTVGGSNDGLFAVPVAGPERGHLKQFLTVPVGAECCGPVVTADGRSVFVAVQHPGETDGSTFGSPSSTWPDRLPPEAHPFPRPSVAVVYRRNGGRVGS